jgi:mediator of RNA polymerase II transcription subunit 7
MADSQQQPVEDEDLILSFFPDPPPFFKHFTTDNLARLKDIEKEAATDDDDSKPASAPKLTAEQILALPTELRYLIPPEPPADSDDFHVFDVVTKAKGTDVFMKNMEYIADQLRFQDVFPDWTYEQLFPFPTTSTEASTLDRQNYLFRFLRSILLSYISLLGIVAANPTSEQKDQKLKDIMTLSVNMHALINEYRPHQARQSLIGGMEEQVRRKREDIEGVGRMSKKVRETLAGFGGAVVAEESDTKTRVVDGTEDGREEETKNGIQKGMWEEVDEMLA